MHKVLPWPLDGYHKAVLTMVRGKTRLTPSPSLKLVSYSFAFETSTFFTALTYISHTAVSTVNTDGQGSDIKCFNIW